MKGLLLKDILSLRGTLMILAVFVAFYAILGFFGENSSMLTGVLAIVVMMLPANSISYDEFYHWDRFVLTMPVSRKMVVQSKYLLCFLLALFVLIIGAFFSFLITGGVWESIFANSIVAMFSLLISVASLPFMLKWGAQKGRLIIVMFCGLAGAVFAIVMTSSNLGALESVQGVNISMELILAMAAIITAIIVMISYLVSCKLYIRKQF